MKSIFLILTLSTCLFSQGSIELPEKMKQYLCKEMSQNDSITNMCEYGSTIEYKYHFITNDDKILLFLYLEEHTGNSLNYPPTKVGLLIDKRGNWSILDGEKYIQEEIRSIEHDPYNGIWVATQWVIEGITPTIYYVEGSSMRRVILPKSKASNGYFETLKEICFDVTDIILKFYPYGDYSAEAWITAYGDSISPNPKWKKVSNNYDKCMSNIKPSNWKIIKNQKSMIFVHSKTHQVIKVLNSQKSKEIFYLQIGAFKNSRYVKMVQDSLSSFPYFPYLKNRKVNKGEYMKLVIGPFTSLDKAKFVKRLLPRKYKDSFIFKEASKY